MNMWDSIRSLAVLTTLVLAGCGPGERSKSNPGIDSGQCAPTGPENTPDTCSDGIDNDCNGHFDCQDPSCSGIGICPVCGTVQHPTGMPIDLPDGIGGTSCMTDADCASVVPGPQHCFRLIDGNGTKECRQSYTSTVHFSGFSAGQTLVQFSDIQSVCVNMSHEWLRDLEIDLVAPSGQKLALDKFEGQKCPDTGDCEVLLGNPLITDGDHTPGGPEMGYQYCWTPTATKPAILPYSDMGSPLQDWGDCTSGGSTPPDCGVLPADNYAASDPWSKLVGATLNGDWEIQVTDLWPIDAGTLHSWTISFNPSIVQSCDPPIQ
jgi:hypothetical protein